MMGFEFVIIPPMEITPANGKLIASNVLEDEYPNWAAGTYNPPTRVIKDNKVYECTKVGGTTQTPSDTATDWKLVGPTNKWKMFDTSNTTRTVRATPLNVTLRPGAVVNGVGFLGLSGQDLRVRVIDPTDGTVYDKTVDLRGSIPGSTWYDYFFGATTPVTEVTLTDLPAYGTADIQVDLTASAGNVGMATCIMGYQILVGTGVRYGARVGFQSYSKIEENEYGDLVLVKRSTSRRGSYEMWITKYETDRVYSVMNSLDAVPTLFIATQDYQCSIIFGIPKEFEITLSYPEVNICSLQLRGMT